MLLTRRRGAESGCRESEHLEATRYARDFAFLALMTMLVSGFGDYNIQFTDSAPVALRCSGVHATVSRSGLVSRRRMDTEKGHCELQRTMEHL